MEVFVLETSFEFDSNSGVLMWIFAKCKGCIQSTLNEGKENVSRNVLQDTTLMYVSEGIPLHDSIVLWIKE